jgi:hypothetical protein
MAGNTPEALIVVLAAQSLHILTYNRPSAFFALGSLPLCSLGLTVETPSIAIFLDVSHALLERITAFGTEEVAIVPVRPESHGVFANDGSLAMLAARSKMLVPVKMAVETEPLVSIISHCLIFNFFEWLALSTAVNARKTSRTHLCGLWTDFQSFEASATGIADKAMRMKALWKAFQSNYAALDWEFTLVACCSCSISYCR